MKTYYFKTCDFELDYIIDFCVNEWEENDVSYDDISIYKDIIRNNYIHSNMFILNHNLEVVAIDDQTFRTKSGDVIWTVIDIDLLEIDDVEYFDLDKYKHLVDYGYEVVESAYNDERKWLYLKAENKRTNYRSFLFNLQSMENLVGYIRKKKIKNLLEQEI